MELVWDIIEVPMETKMVESVELANFCLFQSCFFTVYPSLESEEDNPIFKSRSKKRKNTDDTPYSPTGSAKSAVSGGNLTVMSM